MGDAGVAEAALSWVNEGGGGGAWTRSLSMHSTLKQPQGASRGTLVSCRCFCPCSAHHLLPPHWLRSPGSLSFPAKTPGCPSAGHKGGKGKEGRNARPHSSGGGVEAGMREEAKSLFLDTDLSPSPPCPWGWTSQPSCKCIRRESLGGSFWLWA